MGDSAFRDWRQVVGNRQMYGRVSRAPPRHRRPPVVMVHGLGLSGRYMLPVARAMAHDFQIFLPDLPGFGDSEKPAELLDVAGLADALAGWVEGGALEPVVLLANSFGCQIAVDLAARHPSLVGALVLQGPTTPPEERSWRMQFRRWRQNAPYNRPGMSQVAREDYRKAGYGRVLRTFRLSLRDRPEDKLASIHRPALVVRGEFDPICRGEWAAAFASALPQGQLAVLPHVAHTLVWDAPAELGALAGDFIRHTEML